MPKPKKPYPHFPLTPHAKGWCKKHNGRTRMVCGLLPPDEAVKLLPGKLAEWDREDGVVSAPPQPTSDLAVVDLAGLFLDAKEGRLAEGMDRRTYDEYDFAVRDFCKVVGATKPVSHLAPADFQKHRTALAEAFGPHRQKKLMINVRSMFKWGLANDAIARFPRYGTEYQLPSKRAFRIAEAEREQRNGKLMFEPGEVKSLLDNCVSVNMRAMIFLALNGGYGSTDVATLPSSVVDLDKGTIEYRRTKTGMRRRVLLWPETIKAVRAAMKERPRPADREFENLVFLTRWGGVYVRTTEAEGEDGQVKAHHKDQVGMQFLALCRKAACYKPGRNFYSLRRTFRTFADECGDQRAVALIMGHETGDVADLYVEKIGDERLRRIVEHVRARVLTPEKKASGKGKTAGKAAGAKKGKTKRKGAKRALAATT